MISLLETAGSCQRHCPMTQPTCKAPGSRERRAIRGAAPHKPRAIEVMALTHLYHTMGVLPYP